MTIVLEQVATLTVSAASGCVVREGVVAVVADDDASLHRYALDGRPLEVTRLVPDVMPADAKARKKAKPDFEALTVLPDGTWLALGSGSSPSRHRAVVVGAEVRVISCSPLFEALSREFSELNLEGLAVHGDHLVLAQRGNGAKRENALVRLKLPAALEELRHGTLSGASVASIERLSFGELEGVPLSVTDLAVGPNGALFFSAAAEDTDDPYLDGECTGSVVGELDGPRVKWSRPIDRVVKIEGLAHAAGDRWLLVADADDPTVKAPLFAARLPLPA